MLQCGKSGCRCRVYRRMSDDEGGGPLPRPSGALPDAAARSEAHRRPGGAAKPGARIRRRGPRCGATARCVGGGPPAAGLAGAGGAAPYGRAAARELRLLGVALARARHKAPRVRPTGLFNAAIFSLLLWLAL